MLFHTYQAFIAKAFQEEEKKKKNTVQGCGILSFEAEKGKWMQISTRDGLEKATR